MRLFLLSISMGNWSYLTSMKSCYMSLIASYFHLGGSPEEEAGYGDCSVSTLFPVDG